jgi:hypothetical protein
MAKRFLPVLLIIAALSLAYTSCKKSNDDGYHYKEPTRGYFPLQVGRYVVYDVDSVIWNNVDCSRKERHLNLRYTIADTFTDNLGRASYRIDVLQRVADTGLWRSNTVIYATPTDSGLELTMNNVRSEKMVFPVSDGAVWLGNRLVDTNEKENLIYLGWLYQYVNYLKPYNNGRLNFDNSVTVNEANDSTGNPDLYPGKFASRTYARSVYGYDVGMIYREFTHWTYDPSDPTHTCRKGFSVIMRAIDYR